MRDLISRQTAYEVLSEYYHHKTETQHKSLREALERVPSAQIDAPDKKVGKWIKHKDRASWYCSECTTDDYYAYAWDCNVGEYELQDSYCPNCGAMMEGEEDESVG